MPRLDAQQIVSNGTVYTLCASEVDEPDIAGVSLLQNAGVACVHVCFCVHLLVMATYVHAALEVLRLTKTQLGVWLQRCTTLYLKARTEPGVHFAVIGFDG